MIREDNEGREERGGREEQRKRRPAKARGDQSRRKRPKKRRRKRNPQMIPVLIAVFLILVVGGITVGKMLYDKYSPSREMADTKEYFHLEKDQEMAVLLNDTLLEDKGRFMDGRVYVNVETVYQHLNSRFYWDASENTYLYALPTELVSASVGSSEYSVAKAKQNEGYVILRADGNDIYVALDFINKYTKFSYEYWEEPNRVHIVTEFGGKDVVTAQKEAQVRCLAGIKSPILTTVDKGSTMYVLEEEEEIEEWTRVLTKDGYIGYVRDKQISAVSQEVTEEPEYTEPVYSSITKDHTINLSWHQVTNMDVVTAQKEAQVRCLAGIKSPILTTVDKGSTMYVLEEEEEIEEWTRVLTKDGYIGYVRDKQISAVSQEVTEEPEYTEPVYSSITKDHTINLSWHQVTNMDANENIYRVLANTKGLTTVSPTWFRLKDNDGGIESLASQEYVNYCHQNGVEVWGLVEDITYKDTILDYEIFTKTASRQKLVNNLIAQAIQYGLDGLNLDMEFINADSARGYLQFIRELSIMCRLNGIVLSVDNYVPAEYNKFYDRAEQGVFADYVIIMGYDETPRNAEAAGSVASLGFVEKGIRDTLLEVPKEKVINAMPFYTRFWKTDENGEVTSEALGMDSATQRAANNSVEPVWDETTGQYYIELEYEGSIYQMWLEEERSIEEKLKLIKQYELAGVASWRLGYERASIWDIILRYVN